MVLPTYGYIPDDMDLVTGKMNEITMDKMWCEGKLHIHKCCRNVSELRSTSESRGKDRSDARYE